MKALAIVLLCVALVTIACTETAQPTNNTPTVAASPTATKPIDPLAVSRENYQKNCESCHGPTGEGGLVKVDNKEIKVPSIKSEHAMKKTDEQITRMINNGDGPMPAFKDKMTPEQISELVKFVRKEIQGN